jgi:hypothetical protein
MKLRPAFVVLFHGLLLAIQPSNVVDEQQLSLSSSNKRKRDESESDDENSSEASTTSSNPNPQAQEERVSEEEEEQSFDTDDQFHPHAPKFDVAAKKYSFQERVIHFLSPGNINHLTRCSVERAILIEAGTIVTDDKTTDSESRNRLMLKTYLSILDGFEDTHFAMKVKAQMRKRLYQAKSDLSGRQLWEKFKDVCGDLRSNYNIKAADSIPSGKQLRDVWNLHLSKMYAEHSDANVSAHHSCFYY